MLVEHFIITTAGHVDHGKSSLVKALTGIDPDRLPEEKLRGITIDLGFAHLDVPSPSGPSKIFRLGIVDVPGHEDFVKNMVAGVGAIDLALLVVAADDGWMPQTEEHLQILDYLGATRGIVALTKIDLASRDEEELILEIRAKLKGSSLENAPIIPTSVQSGRGLDHLVAELARLLENAPSPKNAGKPRLPVDRVFSLHGIGTIATGTLVGGTLQRNQPVTIQPWGGRAKIRSIQSHNLDAAEVGPGTRTAVNLADVAIAGAGARGIARGDVITLEGLGEPVKMVSTWITKSARLSGEKGPARPLKDGVRLRWHQGSANFAARVRLLDAREVHAGSAALAILQFEEPVFVLEGERFILRDWSEQATLGGGMVLEIGPRPQDCTMAQHVEYLRIRAENPRDPAKWLEATLIRDHFQVLGEALACTVFAREEAATAIELLRKRRIAEVAGHYLLEWNWGQSQLQKVVDLVDRSHREHPERIGLPISELRQAFNNLDEGIFEAVLASLVQKGFQQTGIYLRRLEHRQQLPPHLVAAGTKVHALLDAKPLEPPSRKEVAPDPLSQQAMRFFIDTREAVELGPEVVLLRDHYDRAVEMVRSHLRTKGPATVSELRQILGTSRRIAVPLLERMDKEGITRREGDLRVLK